jgi:crotonobetainyl-CoA:carnitine CoA-transferase CaiB-like acyl-CoA transferase
MAAQPMALEGIRVLDLSFYLPGPFCTMMLADLGADVLHVERPGVGDPARDLPVRMGDTSALDWWVNRNKRSVALDLKSPAGREAFLDLVRRADIVVEGFRPGVADRLGVGYEACAKTNKAIIYCALSGYGQTGPYRDRPGHDINYAAESGMFDVTGHKDGPPVVIGFPVTDVGAGGLVASTAILAAYVHRLRTGEGQMIDVSILDGSVAMAGMQIMHALAGTPPVRGVDMNSGGVPYSRLYETADRGHIAVGSMEPHFWELLCRGLGRPDLAAAQHDPSVGVTLEALFREHPLPHWAAVLGEVHACVSPVVPVGQVKDHPQVRDREMITLMADRQGTLRPQVANPIRMSRTPPSLRSPAPQLGQCGDA